MYNALDIRNIYNLGYGDAIFDQKDKEKRAIKQGVESYKLAYATHNIDPDKFPLVKSLPPERIMKFIDDIGEKYPEKHVDDILIILEKELRNKKYE